MEVEWFTNERGDASPTTKAIVSSVVDVASGPVAEDKPGIEAASLE
jgi:hypothetical protein